MKLTLRRSGSFADIMAGEYLAGERAVTAAMRIAAATLKSGWRAQVTGAGLGSRLANTVRSEAYPKGTDSMNAAAMVWTKAPKLIGAFDTGPLIRSKDGFWLAIPTKAAGMGSRGRKITPNEWEQRTGRNLQFIYRRGRTALLIDNGTARFRGRSDPVSMVESGRARRFGSRKRQSVVIFTLVPQVKLEKKLDLDRETPRVLGAIEASIVSNWKVR
jgi:hypothetical protein